MSKSQCRECGGTDLEWQCMQVNKGAASDGQLKMHDVHTTFVLSCTECSEDVRRVSGDDVAVWMNESNSAPATKGKS